MKFATQPSTGGASAHSPDFSVYTSAIEIDPEQENVVRMVGSSTVKDLHGDTMDIAALTDMTQVEPGQTTWLNHNYTLPDSLFGSLIKTPMLTLEAGIADIHIVSDVEMSNPNAVQTLRLIKNGRRLGCSIGCMVTEFEIDEENDNDSWWPPIIILHVYVLEYSVVGIPANQRCWVEPATKGLFERMAGQGRGDEALKLAPAVRGLYPRAYDDYLKGMDNTALRRDLDRIVVRSAPKHRVEWVPNERTFVMNVKGTYKSLKRDDVSALLTKGTEQWSGQIITNESVPGIVPSTSLLNDFLGKGASGKTSWPLADEDTAWDKGAAHKRIMDWAGGDDTDWAKVKSVHFWFGDDGNKWGDFKLPFCDVVSGEVKAVPHAIYACTGGHGLSAADIPEDDVPAIKSKIETYYHKMGKKAPWEEKEEDAAEPDVIEAVTVQSYNPDTGRIAIAQGVTNVTVAGSTAVQSAHTPLRTALSPLPPIEDEGYGSILSSGAGSAQPDPLDVQLYNALAAKFGIPPLAVDASSGEIIKSAFTPRTLEEILVKALNIAKSGREFSKDNQQALQDLHDGIVNMSMPTFHPCEEMGTNPQASDNDGDEDDTTKALQELLIRSLAPLQEQLTSLVSALSQHALDPAALKSLHTQAQALNRQFGAISGQMKATKEDLSKLRNMPLGRPTQLHRSLIDDDSVATYQDFAGLARKMNANERRWTLEEALKETTVVQHMMDDGGVLNYRQWPDGVGGSVASGVRPELTGTQRSWMSPRFAAIYTDGGEAAVPCYDDPAGVPA